MMKGDAGEMFGRAVRLLQPVRAGFCLLGRIVSTHRREDFTQQAAAMQGFKRGD